VSRRILIRNPDESKRELHAAPGDPDARFNRSGGSRAVRANSKVIRARRYEYPFPRRAVSPRHYAKH
jgi:hypothetical protein